MKESNKETLNDYQINLSGIDYEKAKSEPLLYFNDFDFHKYAR